jgi:hypothetical protein
MLRTFRRTRAWEMFYTQFGMKTLSGSGVYATPEAVYAPKAWMLLFSFDTPTIDSMPAFFARRTARRR